MFLLLFGVCLLLIFLWAYKKNNYWKDNNIPYLPSNSIFGNFQDFMIMRKSIPVVFSEIYYSKDLQNLPFFGIRIFHMPSIFVKDPELIKNMLVKDFHHFSDRLTNSDESDPVGKSNLFLMNNPEWKRTRTRLTHVFSAAKMKKAFHLINELGIELNDLLLSNKTDSKTNSFLVEMKGIASRYSTDNIASVAFALQGNSIKDVNSNFYNFGKKIFEPSIKRMIEFGSFFFLPQLVPVLKFKFFTKETVDFMRDMINQSIDTREKNGEVRGDLIDALVALKNEDKDEIPEKGKFRKIFFFVTIFNFDLK